MVLQYLAAGGQFLSGLGQAASAFGIGGGGGLDRKEYRDQLVIQNKVMRDSIAPTMEAYEAAGVHPIYALGGTSAQFSAPQSVGDKSDVGQRMQDMGQGIGRAAEAYSSIRERLQNRMLNAQIEGQELDNVKKAADARLATQAATPGLVDPQGSSSISALPGHPGMEAAHSPALKTYKIGRSGHNFYGPTQELGESLEGMGAVGGTIAGADLLLRGILPEYWADIKRWYHRERGAQIEKQKARSRAWVKGYRR